MKKQQGFTLIELLAVIIILAVIALISTPIIIGVIEKARKGAFEDSAYGIVSAGEIYFTSHIMDDNAFVEKNFNFSKNVDELKISGLKPDNGFLSIDKNGEQSLLAWDKDKKWCAKKAYSEEKITISDYKNSQCNGYLLESATGTIKDLSKNKNDGVNHGVKVENGEAILDGNSYIIAGYPNRPIQSGITYIVRFYYRSTDNGINTHLLGNWESANGGLSLLNGNFHGEEYFGSSYAVLNTNDVQDNQYHVFVFTVDGNNLSIYVDGILKESKTATGARRSSSVPYAIGGNPNGNSVTDLYTGKITDVLVIERGVNASEVATNFKDNIPVLNDDAVLFQYKF